MAANFIGSSGISVSGICNDVIVHTLGDGKGGVVMGEALKDVSAFIPERHMKQIWGS